MIKKKVFGVGVAIAIVLSLCACEKKEPEKTKRVFLTEQAMGRNDKEFSGFGNVQSYGIHTKSEKKQLSDVKKEVEVSVSLKEKEVFKYSHSECKKKNDSSMENGSFYSVYDYYRSDDTDAVYLNGTDILCFYSTPSDDKEEYPEKSESEIRKIAEEFLLSVMDKETFEKFDYLWTQKDVLGRYTLLYVRKVAGYETDETISIWIEKSGKISAYNAFNLKKYDTLEATIDKSKVEEAKADLKKEIAKLDLAELDISREPELITNADGEIFLKQYFQYKKESGDSVGEIVYVNLE